ncbi:MAG: metallophosphoesterase family protein [Pseudomonadota bacterium]
MTEPIAVIADIHGNSDALTAVLADIDALGVKVILNLGDHFSGPLAAAETADLLLSRDMINIRGNHDRILIEDAPETMGASDRVAFDQLSSGSLDWLRALPETRALSSEIFMCHGTPESDSTYWLETVLPEGEVVSNSSGEIENLAVGLPYPLLLCGHTHRARSVRLADGRLVVNPGSVGLPGYDDDLPYYHVMQSGSPDASYALVEKIDGQWRCSFRLVPYDSNRMANLAKAAGRPDWASAVATGWLTSTN